jgi:hypothetical protein
MSWTMGLSSCVLRNALRFEHALKVQGCPHSGYRGETGSGGALYASAVTIPTVQTQNKQMTL